MTTGKKSNIPTPRDYLGFEVGADRKLADWPQVAEYLRVLGDLSDRVETREIGKSTEGHEFLLVMVSSPDNLKRADEYRRIQKMLSDPRQLDGDQEADELIRTGKVVVAVTCSIHATEVGATQMSMMLAHHLATSDDPDVKRILDEVILLLVPSLNPDGLVMVKEWYYSTLGTNYEGAFPPFLYNKYTGHDNNRDWFMFTQQETRLVVEHVLNAWHPQILYDLHQTRSSGMRMILPPFVDPVGPNVDPILQSELSMLGSAMAAELTSQGKGGVAVNVVYDAYSPSRSYLNYHAGIRVLSEAASVRIATPVELDRGRLKTARGEEPNRKTWNHPDPWTGGRWTLRDIVEYDFAAVMACLNNAARYKDQWIRNFYLVGKRAVSELENPYAYLVPPQQHDRNAAAELLDIMHLASVEMHEASEPFEADGKIYPAGTTVIMTQQPYGSFAKTMLEVRQYPDTRKYPGGPPKEPYDVTAHSLPLHLGVDAVEVKAPFEAELTPLDEPRPPAGRVIQRAAPAQCYLLGCESNASANVVNMLLAKGLEVHRASASFESGQVEYAAGTFVIPADGEIDDVIKNAARSTSLMFESAPSVSGVDLLRVKSPRIAVYKGFIPTTEEGWTRFVLDEYGFSYRSITDADVVDSSLNDEFDAIIVPHQAVWQLRRGHDASSYDPRYSGGLGEAGAISLRQFVENGGTLITWDGSARYAIQHLGLPVTNILAGLSQTEFYAPGSLLNVKLDTKHPVAFGMPKETVAMFLNGPAFAVHGGEVIGEFSEQPLANGWLIGPQYIRNRAAAVSVPMGAGRVILFSFRVHFRAQVRVTYKLLFNSLYYSSYE